MLKILFSAEFEIWPKRFVSALAQIALLDVKTENDLAELARLHRQRLEIFIFVILLPWAFDVGEKTYLEVPYEKVNETSGFLFEKGRAAYRQKVEVLCSGINVETCNFAKPTS